MSESVTTRRRGGDQQAVAKTGLFVGAIGIVVGTLAARGDPATGYEVSIYAATPALFWVAVAVALAVSLGVSFLGRSPAVRRLGLLLGGIAMLAVVGLPLVRGYAFYGTADPMSHLGWVRDLAAGGLWLPALLYPGLHGTAMLVQSVVSGPLTRTMMLVPLVYVLLFLVAVPLAVRALVDTWTAVVVGAFSGFMLLPINNISAHMTAHPSTLAILFTPFVFAVLAAYLREPAGDGLPFTATGAVLALCSVAIVFVHPQQAANLLLVLVSIAALQIVRRRRDQAALKRVYGQTVLLGGLLLAWGLSHQRVVEAIEVFIRSLLTGAGPHTVVQRSDSLLAIGASPAELFIKLFLVSTVFAALTGVVSVAALSGRLDDDLGGDVLAAFSVGLVPVGGLFLLYLAVGINTMFFRHLGFIMAVVTVLGAVGVVYVWRARRSGGRLTAARGGRLGTLVVVGVVGVMLVLSIVIVYPSPYMYQPTSHVTAGALEGHEEAFDHAATDVTIYGIRDGPDRYRDAITGTGDLDSTRYRYATGVTGEQLGDGLTNDFEDPAYLVVTRYDHGRETVAFRSLRYTERMLSTVGDERGVHRVMSNGDVELFLVA